MVWRVVPPALTPLSHTTALVLFSVSISFLTNLYLLGLTLPSVVVTIAISPSLSLFLIPCLFLVQTIRRRVRQHVGPGEAVVMMGDFNTEAHELCVFRGEVPLSPSSSAAARRGEGSAKVGKLDPADPANSTRSLSSPLAMWTCDTGYVEEGGEEQSRGAFYWNGDGGDGEGNGEGKQQQCESSGGGAVLRDAFEDVHQRSAATVEEHATSQNAKRREWIDYIFYSTQHLAPSCLSDTSIPHTPLPTTDEPSDHIALAVRFDILNKVTSPL